MEYKKTIILLALVVFLLSIAGVSASEIDDTLASENANTIELSTDNDIKDNLQTSEENMVFTSTDYDEALSTQTDTEVLGADSATYFDLADEISHSGNITLTHKNYTYNGGGTILISEDNKVIDGNGAVIDMNGSTIRALRVSGSDVTIKNLTIKNANYGVSGGAIYFSSSGTVTNCNFTNNSAGSGGAVYFYDEGSVSNCNFTNNTASGNGGAISMSSGTVSNCNFTGNTASRNGGAVYFYSSGNVTNCNFTDNKATGTGDYDGGGAVYFYLGTGSLTNCNFTGNNASEDGGAVYFYSPGTVTNCNFTGNSARNGGAVYFYDYEGSVSNCNFTNNSATENGGAVYVSEPYYNAASVTNCNFTGNSARNGGAVYFNTYGEVTNCNFTNNKATGDDSYGGAIRMSSGSVSNCNFTGNTAGDWGGAIFSYSGTVSNCNFTNNSAGKGGAINTGSGSVSNCNFADNTVTGFGGAVFFEANGEVINCNFTGNNATTGSAIYFNKLGSSDTLTVSDSTFLNNRANAGALDIVKTENNITITFTGQNNLLNAIYSSEDAEVAFYNVTYWGANGITTISATMSGSNKAAGQKITVGVVVNNELVLSKVMVTKENGTIVLNISAGENYYISARHDTDSYYTEAETTISNNTKFNVNVTSKTTNNKTVNITAKSNIYSEFMPGKLLFILPNGENITANYAGNGTWWAQHTFDAYDVYHISATYEGLDNVTIRNATITVNKIKTAITGNAITATYNINKNLVITLKDSEGNILSGVNVIVNLNGAKTYTTDANGQIKISTKGLTPKAYTAKVTFSGNANYAPTSKDIKITVKKAKPKIKAKKKTYRAKAKTKKFTITLKDNRGKAIKNAKVKISVKKITKKAKKKTTKKKKKKNIKKTNKKGKATFKIDRKTKGKYWVTIKYQGNKYFTKTTKKVKITLK